MNNDWITAQYGVNPEQVTEQVTEQETPVTIQEIMDTPTGALIDWNDKTRPIREHLYDGMNKRLGLMKFLIAHQAGLQAAGDPNAGIVMGDLVKSYTGLSMNIERLTGLPALQKINEEEANIVLSSMMKDEHTKSLELNQPNMIMALANQLAVQDTISGNAAALNDAQARAIEFNLLKTQLDSILNTLQNTDPEKQADLYQDMVNDYQKISAAMLGLTALKKKDQNVDDSLVANIFS